MVFIHLAFFHQDSHTHIWNWIVVESPWSWWAPTKLSLFSKDYHTVLTLSPCCIALTVVSFHQTLVISYWFSRSFEAESLLRRLDCCELTDITPRLLKILLEGFVKFQDPLEAPKTCPPWASGGCNWLFVLVRQVLWVVRDSRNWMWCPHDMGQDSWVWGERDSLDVQFPPRSGGGSPRREDLLVGRNGVALG